MLLVLNEVEQVLGQVIDVLILGLELLLKLGRVLVVPT